MHKSARRPFNPIPEEAIPNTFFQIGRVSNRAANSVWLVNLIGTQQVLQYTMRPRDNARDVARMIHPQLSQIAIVHSEGQWISYYGMRI